MTKLNFADRVKMQLNVGRTSRMLEAGYSFEKIRKKLKLPDATVQKYIGICEEARQRKSWDKAHRNDNVTG